jgi:hypothetical protein
MGMADLLQEAIAVLKELPSDRQAAVIRAILDFAASEDLLDDVADFEFSFVG